MTLTNVHVPLSFASNVRMWTPRCAVLAVSCLVFGGCGPSGPKRWPVQGTVLLDDKPLSGASIVLTPKGEGLSSVARIENGNFSMTEIDGPTQGDFSVVINPNEAELDAPDPSKLAKATRRPRIPRVYQRPGKLDVTVTGEPGQLLEFRLSSKEQ